MKTSLITKDLARPSRNRNSEYLAQRRQARKGWRKTVNNFSKISHLSPPNLAYFAPWRESIPLFEYFNGKFAHAAQTLKDSNIKDVGAGLKPARLQLQRRKYYESKR